MELDKPPTLSPHGRSLTPESNASSLQSTEPVAGSVTVTNLADNPEPIQGEYGINPKNVIPDDLLFPGSPPGTQLFQDATGSYYIREPGNPQRMGVHQDRAREVEKGMNLNGPLPLDPNVYGTDDAGAALEEKNKAQMDGGSGLISSANAASSTALSPDPAKPDVKPVAATDAPAVTAVLKHLLATEGTGDKSTNKATGEGGITDERELELEAREGRELNDKEAREMALRDEHDALEAALPEYTDLPVAAQAAVLDLAYNLRASKVLNMGDLTTAIKNGVVSKVLFETLDTANIAGKTSKGVAVRRARAYNRASSIKIISVEQLADGTIKYFLKDRQLLMSYKKPKHPKSDAGSVTL